MVRGRNPGSAEFPVAVFISQSPLSNSVVIEFARAIITEEASRWGP